MAAGFSSLMESLLGSSGRHEAPLGARPEPVIHEAKAKAQLAAVVTALGTAAVTLGVVPAADAGVLTAALITGGGAVIIVINYVLTMRAAYRARAKVTPLEAPVGPDGVPLVTSLGAPGTSFAPGGPIGSS